MGHPLPALLLCEWFSVHGWYHIKAFALVCYDVDEVPTCVGKGGQVEVQIPPPPKVQNKCGCAYGANEGIPRLNRDLQLYGVAHFMVLRLSAAEAAQ